MDIKIIGLGAIGSYMSIALSKAGIEHIGYDYDIVAAKNIQNQAFSKKHVGMPKALALPELSDMLEAFEGTWKPEYGCGDVVIACADDMETRRMLAENANVMFDTRLAGNQITLFASTSPKDDLLPSMQYDNDDVPDQEDTCHNPSSTQEVVLAAVGIMLKNIKTYIETGQLIWTYCGIDVENASMVKAGN